MPTFLTNIFTANRIAAIVTFLSGLAAFIAGIAGVFPSAWQNAAIAIVGVLTKLVTGFKFLEGSQRWDGAQMRLAEVVATSQANVGLASGEPIADAQDERLWHRHHFGTDAPEVAPTSE